MATSTTTRTIVLTYLAGDCGGLFLLSCCRQKQIESLSNIKFIANRVELQTEIDLDKKNKNQHHQTPTGTYPTITCDEVGLSVSGVLLSLYALGKRSFISLSVFMPFIFLVVTTVIRCVCVARVRGACAWRVCVARVRVCAHASVATQR